VPKINVYLPDELADAVKQAAIPVSAVCQRALEQAVRRVTAIRETTLGDTTLGDLADDDLATRFPQLTDRARTVLRLADRQAHADGSADIGTQHLLGGLLAENGNLALRILHAMEIEPDQLRRDLDRQSPPQPTSTAPGPARRLSGPAANALELAVTEATALGHNYVGCEHLLLGLIAEPNGTAGTILRSLGAEPRLSRRAVAAALAGYLHLRAQAPAPTDTTAALATAIRQELQPLLDRIQRLEHHTGIPATD
jgi:ATP-dependent Clp protease ATP-binding subunit ClpC